MTKSEKKQVVGELLNNARKTTDEKELSEILEKVILEVYSSGFNSINKLNTVSESLKIITTDFIKYSTDLKYGKEPDTDFLNLSHLLAFPLIDISDLAD